MTGHPGRARDHAETVGHAMIRSVAYAKAVLAGMAGAIAWEVVARMLIWSGVPFLDLVVTLGTLMLPHAPPWKAWLAGMLLHLSVGAIWGMFYAYFFWSVLPLRPVLQGLVFAFVPMPLAIFIMHPQFDLMHPLVQGGAMSSSGPFGLSGGMEEPLSIAAGHLVWGAVLGLLYTHPVGYAVSQAPVPTSRPGSRPSVPSFPASLTHRFMFATGIECSYPTIEHGRWRRDEMASTAIIAMAGGFRAGGADRRFASALRPAAAPDLRGPGRYDWGPRRAMAHLRDPRAGIVRSSTCATSAFRPGSATSRTRSFIARLPNMPARSPRAIPGCGSTRPSTRCTSARG